MRQVSQSLLLPFLSLSLWVLWSELEVILLPTTRSTTLFYCQALLQEEDYNDFVREVLDEDAWRHDDDNEDNPYHHEDPPFDNTQHSQSSSDDDDDDENDYYEERLRRKREEERLKQQAEAERLQRQRAEEAFARELESLPAEQQKLLRQKRRKDGKIVQKILSAWQRQDYYAVLGLRWFFPEGIRLIPGRGGDIDGKDGPSSPPSSKKKPKKFDLKQFFLKGHWPSVTILRLSTRQIQMAYRARAVQVHPDKNRDPRTEQAFVAVQDAHAVLSDPALRHEYEKERRQHRLAVRQAWKDRYHKLINTTLRPLWIVVHKILGPMTVPIIVLGALVF